MELKPLFLRYYIPQPVAAHEASDIVEEDLEVALRDAG